ncbi:aldehyde oxidase GLOX1-like [Fagus crenata]
MDMQLKDEISDLEKQENNLYPFVFLNLDGHFFVSANNRTVLLDYNNNKIVKRFPEIPGGDRRSYPSTGSAMLLPLKCDFVEAKILVCGRAPKGSFLQAQKGTFVQALNTCARMKITDPNPKWIMEKMPGPRVMGDMKDPVLTLMIYQPNERLGSRFVTLNATTIPWMYHSSANLLKDGRILVGGSNPNVGYVFQKVLFPTDLRLEAFYPPYFDTKFSTLQPKIMSPAFHSNLIPAPYDVYDQLDPNVPVSTKGNRYDRYCINIEEMRQSVWIIVQYPNQMPSGMIKADDHKLRPPSRCRMKLSMESCTV